MRLIALAMAVFLAACSHSQVRVDAQAASPGGAVQVRSYSNSDFVTLLGLTAIAATIVDMERSSVGTVWRRDDPPLAADRTITEHDCTKPIEEFSGNLRCR